MGKSDLKIDLSKVADAAIQEALVDTQDMTLAEHDLRYHDNHYNGGPCKVRETMENGDYSDKFKADIKSGKVHLDPALEEMNRQEAVLWVAERREAKYVEDEVRQHFKALNTNNSRVQMSAKDANGTSKLSIWCKSTMPDDAVPEKDLEKFLKELGYTTSGYAVMIEKPESENGRTKEKKAFVIDVNKKSSFKLAEGSGNGEIMRVRRAFSDGMSDARKSQLMRQYGYKSEGGKVMKRTADDAQRDRINRYLGIVGDLDGQSNREDVESGIWEKRRIASLKRAQEAKSRDAAAGPVYHDSLAAAGL